MLASPHLRGRLSHGTGCRSGGCLSPSRDGGAQLVTAAGSRKSCDKAEQAEETQGPGPDGQRRRLRPCSEPARSRTGRSRAPRPRPSGLLGLLGGVPVPTLSSSGHRSLKQQVPWDAGTQGARLGSGSGHTGNDRAAAERGLGPCLARRPQSVPPPVPSSSRSPAETEASALCGRRVAGLPCLLSAPASPALPSRRAVQGRAGPRGALQGVARLAGRN